MGLAYTIMAARRAAVALDRVELSMTRGDYAYVLPCRIYRLSAEGSDNYEGGPARRIGSAKDCKYTRMVYEMLKKALVATAVVNRRQRRPRIDQLGDAASNMQKEMIPTL